MISVSLWQQLQIIVSFLIDQEADGTCATREATTAGRLNERVQTGPCDFQADK